MIGRGSLCELVEMELSAALWAVLAGRMKSGREHHVCLSAPALTLLRAVPAEPQTKRCFRECLVRCPREAHERVVAHEGGGHKTC